jgi:hypothetical protein
MGNYYSRVTGPSSTLTSIQDNGAAFDVGISSDISCNNMTVGIVTANSFVSNSTSRAFYPPVVTTTQRDAMTVTAGAMVYNSTTSKINFYNGSAWKVVTSS